MPVQALNHSFFLFFCFFTAFPREEVSNALKAQAFPLFPVLSISAAFLLSRSGTSPKSESGVGLACVGLALSVRNSMSQCRVEWRSQWFHGRLYCLLDPSFEVPPLAATGGDSGPRTEEHIPEQEYLESQRHHSTLMREIIMTTYQG